MRKGYASIALAMMIATTVSCGSDDGPTIAERPTTATTTAVAGATVEAVATPTVPLVATPTPTGRYTVQPGDTLGIIARTFNVSVADLVELNDIPNPDTISVGLELQIPTPSPG
jgi:LysM repeat protein